jgi:dsRNA-specific ribonuclease
MGTGTGSTKKSAEQAAAKQVLERIELDSGS